MEVAKGAVRPRFVTAHPAALAARNSRGQLVPTEPVYLIQPVVNVAYLPLSYIQIDIYIKDIKQPGAGRTTDIFASNFEPYVGSAGATRGSDDRFGTGE